MAQAPVATTAAVLRLDAKNLVGATLLTAAIPPDDRRITNTVFVSILPTRPLLPWEPTRNYFGPIMATPYTGLCICLSVIHGIYSVCLSV